LRGSLFRALACFSKIESIAPFRMSKEMRAARISFASIQKRSAFESVLMRL
jgi:hypothetical protein